MVGLSSNWLEVLISARFFSPCPFHGTARKNERNIFCLDCCSAFCPHCLPPHCHHRLLQIRRYVYHDVIRVDDLERLIDCASIQSYTANSAKVVFLNERPPFRGGAGHHHHHHCAACDRPLPYPFLHCSLACKAKHVVGQEGELRDCDFLPLDGRVWDLRDNGQLSPESVLYFPCTNSSSYTSNGGEGNGAVATAELSVTLRTRSDPSNRRKKGVPIRAPLF